LAEYYFKLPNYEQLTTVQQKAVTDKNPIALSGGPGTGKSVVSVWRHIINHAKEKKTKSQLLTFTTSLAYYLKKCCETISDDAAQYVTSSKNWRYNCAAVMDEIIHDEAQDLPIKFNQWLKRYSNNISYGADDQQLITAYARKLDGSFDISKCSPEQNLRNEFNKNSLYQLPKNYRNTKRIVQFAKQVFPKASIPFQFIESCDVLGEYPRFLISGGSSKKQDGAIIEIIKQFILNKDINIAILVPFATPNNLAGLNSTADYYYQLLKSNNFECAIQTNRMNGCSEIKNLHITTFNSAKGLEFDVVIIPNFHLVNVQFQVIDWRDYYVGVTRTRRNLYLISDDEMPILASEGTNKVVDKERL